MHDGRKLGGDLLEVYEVSMEETTMPALACSAWSARGGRGSIGRRVGTWERDTVWVGSLSWAAEILLAGVLYGLDFSDLCTHKNRA